MKNVSYESWDAYTLLLHNPATRSVTCAGEAKTRGRRCQRNLANRNSTAAMDLANLLPQLVSDKDVFVSALERLAGFMLCPKDHSGQVRELVRQWQRTIASHLREIAGEKQAEMAAQKQREMAARKQSELRAIQTAKPLQYRPIPMISHDSGYGSEDASNNHDTDVSEGSDSSDFTGSVDESNDGAESDDADAQEQTDDVQNNAGTGNQEEPADGTVADEEPRPSASPSAVKDDHGTGHLCAPDEKIEEQRLSSNSQRDANTVRQSQDCKHCTACCSAQQAYLEQVPMLTAVLTQTQQNGSVQGCTVQNEPIFYYQHTGGVGRSRSTKAEVNSSAKVDGAIAQAFMVVVVMAVAHGLLMIQ